MCRKPLTQRTYCWYGFRPCSGHYLGGQIRLSCPRLVTGHLLLGHPVSRSEFIDKQQCPRLGRSVVPTWSYVWAPRLPISMSQRPKGHVVNTTNLAVVCLSVFSTNASMLAFILPSVYNISRVPAHSVCKSKVQPLVALVLCILQVLLPLRIGHRVPTPCLPPVPQNVITLGKKEQSNG